MLLMSKRSRDPSSPPESAESLRPTNEREYDAFQEHPSHTKHKFRQTDSNLYLLHPSRMIQCALAPHTEAVCFETQEEHEVHYTKEHANRCATCSKNFPSPRFLELHIEENHNALRESLAARGEKTYGCFVEDCDRRCSTAQKRRLHLIDKHMFPKTYNFRMVDQGIDQASSMLRGDRRRRVSTANDHQRVGRNWRQDSSQLQDQPSKNKVGCKQTCQNPFIQDNKHNMARLDECAREGATAQHQGNGFGPTDLDGLTLSLSALRFVPTSVLRKQNRDRVEADAKDE